MFRLCRYCGDELDGPCEPLEICPACASSPLCDRCGHARSDHTHVFVSGGPTGCLVVFSDFQSLSRSGCPCSGFQPVRGALRDPGFAESGRDPLTLPLRVVTRDGADGRRR
jgi:hypothetical protein